MAKCSIHFEDTIDANGNPEISIDIINRPDMDPMKPETLSQAERFMCATMQAMKHIENQIQMSKETAKTQAQNFLADPSNVN